MVLSDPDAVQVELHVIGAGRKCEGNVMPFACFPGADIADRAIVGGMLLAIPGCRRKHYPSGGTFPYYEGVSVAGSIEEDRIGVDCEYRIVPGLSRCDPHLDCSFG